MKIKTMSCFHLYEWKTFFCSNGTKVSTHWEFNQMTQYDSFLQTGNSEFQRALIVLQGTKSAAQ